MNKDNPVDARTKSIEMNNNNNSNERKERQLEEKGSRLSLRLKKLLPKKEKDKLNSDKKGNRENLNLNITNPEFYEVTPPKRTYLPSPAPSYSSKANFIGEMDEVFSSNINNRPDPAVAVVPITPLNTLEFDVKDKEKSGLEDTNGNSGSDEEKNLESDPVEGDILEVNNGNGGHAHKPSILGEDFELKLEDLTWLDALPPSTPNTPGIVQSQKVIGFDEEKEDDEKGEGEVKRTGPNPPLMDLQLDPIQKKKNIDFHINFPSLPLDDILIEDFHCALQKDILVTGRLYVTSKRICFHSNLFGWVNHTIIPFDDMVSVQKKSTAFVIPNAIQIITLDQKYFFTSFMARDTVFNLLYDLWHKKCPNRCVEPPRPSTPANPSTPTEEYPNEMEEGVSTLCPCLTTNSSHEGYLNLDTTYPIAMNTLFELLYGKDNAFLREYLSKGNTQVEIDDWKDNQREIRYIKPLHNPLGPKQTRCITTQSILKKEYTASSMAEERTRNPDVPSGDAFVVVTRYCFMIYRTDQVRMVVTTWLEWSKSSWFKGPIEAGTKEGTTQAAQELDQQIRGWIEKHPELRTSMTNHTSRKASLSRSFHGMEPSIENGSLFNSTSNKFKKWIGVFIGLLTLLLCIQVVYLQSLNKRYQAIKLQHHGGPNVVKLEEMVELLDDKLNSLIDLDSLNLKESLNDYDKLNEMNN